MRQYPFELPLNVPHWTGHLQQLINKIVEAKLWDELPVGLIVKIDDAAKAHHGVTITQADLDSIPDKTWAKVETALERMMR